MRLSCLLLALAAPSFAQHLHLGVKGGVPLNDLVESKGQVANLTSRWTLGPMLEIDLPAGLGVELDLFYRRLGYREAQEHRTGSWEFPLAAKYRFPGLLARPYIGGGFVFRNVGDIPRLSAGSKGLVFLGGVTIKAPLVRISPEIRWTRWESSQSWANSIPASRNQFEVLLGLSF